MTTPTTTAYYSSDAVGSTTALSSSNGTLLGSYDSQPFGDNPTSTSVDPSVAGNPFGFAGEYQDPISGLYNLRARNYDPTTSRLLAGDPLGPQAQQSTYVYAGDNPLGQIDPSGLRHTPSCSLLCQAGGALYQCAGNTACNTAFLVGTTLIGDPEAGLELEAEASTAKTSFGLLSRLRSINWLDETGSIRFGRAPEYYGGQLSSDEAMNAAEKWLGFGYRETSLGRFISADGARIVRYSAHETGSAVEHIHFEATLNGSVIENTWAAITP